jgi:type VI secretion system ImpB/VipA family protein
MADSTQKKLERVRPPRIQINYEVETGGAIELKELPFLMGVLGDFTGSPPSRCRSSRSGSSSRSRPTTSTTCSRA